jgi:ferric-dicitrate binding protein FerR (iron transport regulator)
MKQLDETTWKMITWVITKEAEPAEKEKFQRWLCQNPNEREYLRNIKEAWKRDPQHKGKSTSLFDDEKGLKKLRCKISQAEKKGKRKTPSFTRSYLARWKMVASIALLLAAISFLVIRNYWSPPITEYATTALDHRIINLPDGSVVHLNRNSEISFRKGFTGSTRTIHLTGEAYLSWMDGLMIFKKVPFDQVIRQLDHIYGIHCSLSDSSLADLKLTAYVRNTSLRDVLHMISVSLSIHYQKKGKRIIWKKRATVSNRS